jgi:hypothetical protein
MHVFIAYFFASWGDSVRPWVFAAATLTALTLGYSKM